MKIDAKVEFKDNVAEELDRSFVRVPVDIDYVEADEDDIISWITDKLENMFGRTFCSEDFKVSNMTELVEEIKFDEFKDKTEV